MRALGRLAVIMAVGAVAVVGTAYATGFDLSEWQHLGKPRNVLVVEGEQIRIPIPDGPSERRASSLPVTTDGSHAFMFEETAQGPTRYDPCRAVEWTHNPTGMPEGADQLVRDAVADVARHTGLVFEYVGETDEVAGFDRPLFQERYGEGFSPVIVGWSTEEQTPELAGSVTGLGGSSSVNGAFGEQRFLAAGVVVLDTQDVTELMESRRGTALATAVIMHELAHVIGLAHVDDPTELMNDENSMLITWGPGDRAGLAIAGAGPCQ
ncbi:matrixin family metalloprotease [Demequina aestuarii]|uniref:matrixin family metalloprotease n=1 Tax=Demequina aestuarii TaxID=327095 RepID=UPI000ABA66BE|nr:matrixin family metalloprotease [Demequina aestuarii]